MIDGALRGLLLSSSLFSILAFWFYRRMPRIERVIRALIVPGSVITAGIFAKFILSAPFWDRNASRLVGAFCVRMGLPLYPTAEAGAVQSMNYPPLAAYMYWPATFFPTPTYALLAGTLLTVFYFYAPVFFVFYFYGRRPGKEISRPWIFALCLGFTMICLMTSSLTYSGFHLHADAAALGFGALACIFCSAGSFFLSAGMAVSSLWSKQSLLPLFIALPLYVGIVFGRKQAIRYGLMLIGWSGAFLALTLLQVSGGNLMFNLLYIGKKPFAGALGDLMTLQCRELLVQHLFFALLIVCVGARGFTLRDLRASMKNNPWTLWVLVAFFMTPVALVNRCTTGGDINAFSLVSYFLTIGAFLLIAGDLAGEYALGAFWARRCLVFLVGLLCATQGFTLFHFGLSGIVQALPMNPQETAFHYAREHPGEAYFPWNPLSTLMAEKRLYHFEPAVADWALAGHPLTKERYERSVPLTARFIAYPVSNEFTHETTLKRLPQFDTRVEIKSLPGWIVYARQGQRA